MDDRWISEEELEKISGRKRQSLRNDRCLGRGFPYYKCGKKSVRYKLSECLAQMESYRVEVRQAGRAK